MPPTQTPNVLLCILKMHETSGLLRKDDVIDEDKYESKALVRKRQYVCEMKNSNSGSKIARKFKHFFFVVIIQ